jgi:hypothetical protein
MVVGVVVGGTVVTGAWVRGATVVTGAWVAGVVTFLGATVVGGATVLTGAVVTVVEGAVEEVDPDDLMGVVSFEPLSPQAATTPTVRARAAAAVSRRRRRARVGTSMVGTPVPTCGGARRFTPDESAGSDPSERVRTTLDPRGLRRTHVVAPDRLT